MTNYIKKLLALAVAAGAMTAMDARAASGAMDYSRWSQNPYVATWKGTASDLTSAGTSLYSQFDISDPLNPIDSEVTWGNGNSNVEIPGYGNYWAWSIFCVSTVNANANHYQAPGNVLRFAPGAGTPDALGAALSELAFGGLIVEEGATGYSLVQGGTGRATGLGNNSTEEGIKEKEDWFDIRENFSFNRTGAFTLYGILNIDIAAGRIFDLNSAQSATAANHPTLHVGTNAQLKMHGEGTLKVPTLIATGSVTLDYSDLASRVNTEPFIDGNLTVDGSTAIVFPAGWAENEPYKLCSGALTAPNKSGRMIIHVGEEEITGVLTYDTANATVSYAEDRSSSEPLLVNFMKGAPLTPTAGWLDWGVTANSATLQGSAAYIGGERTAHLTSTANGNFIAANTEEVANDFTAGSYSDIYGRIHSSIVEEVKASLDLDETTVFDETVYKTGLMNGGHTDHMATIANLVPGHRYVIYIGTGRLKLDTTTQTSGILVPAEGSYTSLGAIEYVVTAASDNNPVATAYTKANPGDAIVPGVNGLLLVRISNVIPTASGEFKFQFKGQRAGINFLAVKELNLEEAELSANLDSLEPLQKSKLRGGTAPALVETGTAPTLTPVRGSATNKATKFTAGGFYTIDSSTVCAEDFSLLAVAKLSEATAAPKVIMSIGNASWTGGSKGLTLVLDGNIVKLVNWSHPTQNAVIALDDSAVLLAKEVQTARTQFHSYFVTYDNANSKVNLFVDGIAANEEGVVVPVVPNRDRLELARIFGGTQYFKLGSEGAPFTGGTDFEFDEVAVWSRDMSQKALWIAEDYPIWPNMIDYTASGDIALSQIEAELGEDASVNLTMPADSTLTIDKAIGDRLRLNSTGELTVKGGETHALSAQDVNLVEKGEQGTVKILFTADSVTTDLVAPASGITYRFEGTTLATAPFIGTDTAPGNFEGVVELACPLNTVDDLVFCGTKNYIFADNFTYTSNGRISIGNNGGVTQNITQTGGTITQTKDNTTATGNLNVHTPLLIAHWSSTVTYNLEGGSLLARNGIVAFGWDGVAHMTVGGVVGKTALFAARGIDTGTARNNTADLTILAGGTLEIGDRGISFGTNKALTLAGGTLSFTADSTNTFNHPNGLALTAESTIEVASGKTATIESAITGTGTILKTGEGILDVKSSRPIVDVQAGKIRLTARDEEIFAGKIELEVPTGASAASTDKVIVVDAMGETLKITGATISGTKLTLTLDAIQITEATAISSLNLADDATSPVVVLGGASAEEAYDVTFDKALPPGVMLLVSGHVNFVGSGVTTFPATQIELSENASLQIDKPFDGEFTIKAHTTLAIDGEVTSTHRILVENFYSTLRVNPGATLIFDLEEAGNPIQNTDLTDLRTNGTFELYGTLDFGANDWTHNFYGIYGGDTNDMHCAISLYAGSKITGTGSMIRQGGALARYQLKQGEGEEKYATIDIKMMSSSDNAGHDTIFDFEAGAGLKLSKANSRAAEHNKLRGTIGYFEALGGETYTLKHEEEADFVSKIDGTVFVNEGDTLKLEGLTDASVIVKQGAGVLDIGTQAVAVKIEAGKVKVLATSDNLAEKRLVLPLPSGVTEVSKANYMVVDVQGNEVEIDTAAIFLGTITLILDSLPFINASTSISALNLPETASGLLIIEGGNSAENAITITFDQALPEGVTISMKGFIRLVTTTGVEIPYAKMTFEEGCTLMFDTIDGYTIPEGAIVIAGTASGNIVNNGTLTITGGGNFKLTNAANKTVRFTGGISTVTADQQGLKGVIEIARGATFVNGTTDAMWYGGAVTVKVWGTLDMAATRWSMGANSKVIAYDGAVIIGAENGQNGNGSFDPINANMTYLIVSNEGLAAGASGTVTNSAPTRVREACKVEVAENMTLVNSGKFINKDGHTLTKTGAGKLVQSADSNTTGEITVEAGTLELNASAGSTVAVASNITGAGNLVLSGEGMVRVRGIELTGTKTYTAAKILLNGTTIDYNVAVKTANLTTHYIAESGTNTVKWVGGVNNGVSPICDNDSKEDPFIKVNAGATVNIHGHDYSGWLGSLRDTGWIVNNGTLVFQNEVGTRFFREHLVMGNGSVTKIDHGATPLLLYGGAGSVDGCQLMLPSGTATISAGAAGANAAIHLGDNGNANYGTKGAGISVGEGATLTISLPVKGKAEDPITKWGEGTLVFTGSFEGYNATEGLILNGGTLKLAPACGTVSVKTTVVGKNLIESTDENGNKVYTLSMASIEGDTLTSAITFPEGVDAVYVVGGEDCEHPITVTFDTNLPEGKKIVPINHVDLKLTGNNLRELPMRQVELIAGGCVRLFAPVGEVDGVASLTIPAGVTVKTEVNQEIILTSEGTFVVENKATATVTASGAQAIKGTVTIAKGAKLINLTDDAIAYSANTGTTVEVYGDLNMGTNRWTIGGTSALNLHGGCAVTGEGGRDSYGKGVFDIMRAGNTINVLTGEALADDTVTIEGIVRIRDADGRINIAEGMKLALPGGLRGCDTLNGKVTRVGNGHFTGTVNLIAGANTFLLDYQSITGAPADLRFVAMPGESEQYRETKLKWKAAETDDMGDTADDPFVTIAEGAQLSLECDFKGANYLKNDGTLVFMAASRHFDKTMTLGDGALVKVNSTTSPLDFGGTITVDEEVAASIVQGVDSENHNARINFLEGATVNVGSGAKLTFALPLDGAALTMNGTGKIVLGENRHAVKFTENGELELTASAEEITEGQITLPIPEEGAVAERKLSVITDGGTPIDIAKTASGEGVMIITLDTNTIVKDTNLSNVLKNGEESVGVILIRGGETHDKAVTLIFDRELPAGMSIRLSGHVTFYGLSVNSYPVDRIQIAAGSCLKIDKPFDKAYEIPAGNTLYMAVAPTQAITGSGTLVFDPGEGNTITATQDNSGHTGATTIASGVVKMGHNNCFGANTIMTTVLPGATLDFNGRDNFIIPITLAGGAVVNNGNDHSLNHTGLANTTISEDSFVGGDHRLISIASGWNAHDYNLNGHTLTKIGGGVYRNVNATYVGGGKIAIDEGTYKMVGGTVPANTVLSVDVRENATLAFEDNHDVKNDAVRNLTVNGTFVIGGEGSVTGFNLYPSAKPVTITATEKGALTFDSAIPAQSITIDCSTVAANAKIIPLLKVTERANLPEVTKLVIPQSHARWALEQLPGGLGYRLVRPNFVLILK